MLRRRLPPAIRLCSPCPCLRIQASKSAYRRCEKRPSHADLSDRSASTHLPNMDKSYPTMALAKATQIMAINRHGCHSFEATTVLSCLHHKPRSWNALHKRCWAQNLRTQQQSAPPRNRSATLQMSMQPASHQEGNQKHVRMTLSILLRSYWSQNPKIRHRCSVRIPRSVRWTTLVDWVWVLLGPRGKKKQNYQIPKKHETHRFFGFFGAPGQLRFEAFHQITLKHQPPRQNCEATPQQKSRGEHWNIKWHLQSRNMSEGCLSPQHGYSPHSVRQTLWG